MIELTFFVRNQVIGHFHETNSARMFASQERCHQSSSSGSDILDPVKSNEQYCPVQFSIVQFRLSV